MASVNFALDVIEDDPGRHGRQEDDGPLVKYYRVSGLIPAPEDPLHKLMKREPAVWAAVQVSSGILSVALGVMFAVSFNIGNMFLTLFRVPIISGILFLVAGFFSALLYRNPALLQMCFQSNIICLGAAAVGAVLLCVDLGKRLSNAGTSGGNPGFVCDAAGHAGLLRPHTFDSLRNDGKKRNDSTIDSNSENEIPLQVPDQSGVI